MLVFQSAPAYTLGPCRHLPVPGLSCGGSSCTNAQLPPRRLVFFHVAVAVRPDRAGTQ